MTFFSVKAGLLCTSIYLVSRLLSVGGLRCYDCTGTANRDCFQKRLCSVDQKVCSYLVSNSPNGPPTVEKRCEQAASCENQNTQPSRCINGQCKYCCLEDNCNTGGPKTCICGKGTCSDDLSSTQPVLFCRNETARNIACYTQHTWQELMDSDDGYYLATPTEKNRVTSCKRTNAIVSQTNFTMSLQVNLLCSRVDTRSGHRPRSRLFSRLGNLRFSNATNSSVENRLEIACNKQVLDEDDYQHDWKCKKMFVFCKFTYTPLITTMAPEVTNATAAPVVAAAGLDVWAYVVIIIAILGVILGVGFARNIIKAIKNSGFYRINRVKPKAKPKPQEKMARSSKVTEVEI